MSTDYNPYAAPLPLDVVAPTGVRRPRALTAICVIAIILGGFGLLSAIGGFVGALLAQRIQTAFAQPSTGSGPLQTQAEMQGAINSVTNRFLPVNIAFSVVHLPLATCMLLGAIMSLSGKPKGRRILAGACLAAIVFVIAQTVLGLFVQTQTMGVMSEHMPKMIATGPQNANSQAAQEVFTKVFSVSMYIGVAIVIVIALAKLAFFALGAAYLNKRDTRAYFGDAK